jgi:ribokinase
MADVVVVGSINHDLTVMTPRHPLPGETVLGTGHFSGGGGKGANQAVAVARLGGSVEMVGRVGSDSHGETLRSNLADEGVGISQVMVDPGSATGLALITVDEAAENTIVVSPGANSRLDTHQVERSGGVIGSARVVLCQLDIPLEAVISAAGLSRGIFCLNPAPGMELPPELLTRVDVLIPNLSELALISGVASADPRTALASARMIEGARAVVVTLGAEGALIVEDGESHHIGAAAVSAVDTTGAGDAFCGALALALARGEPLVEAARWAMVSGALATTVPGAQASMPTKAEVEAFVSANGLPPST